MSFPFDVSYHDLTGARGAEGAGSHRGLEEEERKVGILVGGNIGGDDGSHVDGLSGTSREDSVKESLLQRRGGGGNLDVEVGGSNLDGRKDAVSRSEAGEQGGGVGRSGGVVGGGGVGSGGIRVGDGLRLDNLIYTVFLVGRVNRANGGLQRVHNINNVVKLPDIRVVAGRRSQLGETFRVELAKPFSNSRVITSAFPLADRRQSVVDSVLCEVIGGDGGGGEGRSSIDERGDAG